jgi:hypothetical protein
MSTAERIHELPLTPRDLALQLQAEACEPGGDLDWEERFAKLMEGRHKALRHAEHIEYAQFCADGKAPKMLKRPEPSTLDATDPAEQAARKLEVAAAKIRRDREREQAKADVKLTLLDLVAPNNKLWRELSITEYMTFGERQLKHGKKLIAGGHKASELLGAATTEAEIRKELRV